ncbi:MAG: Alpha-D-kanosaminyltransferase [Chloroflexi bacterium ADurb.Bin325]|nr:MAG: Alpha-D-kanosaminyltransferase [Chloroflexi bacterium ADurb.Bin325]
MRPDVVHLLSNNVLWLNLAVPLWGAVPLITTVHDVITHPGDRETSAIPAWSTRLILRQSDHLVVHGPKLREHAVQLFGKPGNAVHVLAHPSIQRYAAIAAKEAMQPRDPDGFNVLLFGRVYRYKGLEHLIRAEALLGERVRGLRITIAGRGDDARSLHRLMGDPGRYEVCNRFIPDAEVAQLFVDADVVVLPYVEASQSGVLNIAATFGKPVIVTDVGELGATVEPAGIGLVVPPADPERLANAIARLAGSRPLRQSLGLSARCWAEGVNAPETVGARAAELYTRVARQ